MCPRITHLQPILRDIRPIKLCCVSSKRVSLGKWCSRSRRACSRWAAYCTACWALESSNRGHTSTSCDRQTSFSFPSQTGHLHRLSESVLPRARDSGFKVASQAGGLGNGGVKGVGNLAAHFEHKRTCFNMDNTNRSRGLSVFYYTKIGLCVGYTLCPGKKVKHQKMCDRNVEFERILTKLCALNSEYMCERTTKFYQKILFNCGVINLQISMTKYLCFQYSVTYGTAVNRTEVTLC